MQAKKPLSLIMAFVMLFMTCFIGFGYAAVVDTLRVEGYSETRIPKGLFISQIIVKGMSDVEHHEVNYLPYSTTVEALIDKKNDTTIDSNLFGCCNCLGIAVDL